MAALIQLTKGLAFELAWEGLQVHSVSPGPIATPCDIGIHGRIPGIWRG
jgi:NAD(P)-dependent dehydrogenase (short-subunit alcohol dehydrogenase family)